MTFTKTTTGYVLRFTKDEKLIEQLTTFVKEHKVTGAWINGLGTAEGVDLGYYDLESQEYHWKQFTELMEITSLQGNVAWQNDDPVLHIHGTFSDEHFQAIGGHVKELAVGGTCEIRLTLLGKKKSSAIMTKKPD